jgi:hypothetical protein
MIESLCAICTSTMLVLVKEIINARSMIQRREWRGSEHIWFAYRMRSSPGLRTKIPRAQSHTRTHVPTWTPGGNVHPVLTGLRVKSSTVSCLPLQRLDPSIVC